MIKNRLVTEVAWIPTSGEKDGQESIIPERWVLLVVFVNAPVLA